MEQELFRAIWWWAVGLVFGLSLRILWGAVKGNIREYGDLDDYVKHNAVILTLVAVSYTALVILWRTTSLVEYIPFVDKLDIVPGVINAWSIVICFLADLIFAFVIRKFQDKIGPQDTPA